MPCHLNKEDFNKLQNQLLSKEEYERLSTLFKMLADPTRLKIFTILAQREVCVDDLASLLGMTQSAISHQLSSLRRTNLVKAEKIGKHSLYSLADDHVMQIFSQAYDHIHE